MTKELFFILSVLPAISSTTLPLVKEQTLALHPLYFTIDGSPAETEVKVDNQRYRIKWDGRKLSMKQPTFLEDVKEFATGLVVFTFPWVASLWLWGLILTGIFGPWYWFFVSLIFGGIGVTAMCLIVLDDKGKK